MNDIKNKIKDAVIKAQNKQISREELYTADVPAGKNEFLFFIKPDITTKNDTVKMDLILDSIFEKIEKFGFKIQNVKVLGASYLKEHDIIGDHYGVINNMAQNAKKNISNSAKEKFAATFGKSIDDAIVLGGLEFMEQYKEFTPYTLDILVQNKENFRIGGGTHVKEFKVDDQTVYIVNGFFPRMLHHFTEDGRNIVVMSLTSDTDWKTARVDMIGFTNPADSNAGSMRKEFLDRQQEFGLPEVSQGMNGVHLSAGPVEGLIELIRYNSDFSDASKVKTLKDFSFGKQLIEALGQEKAEKVLTNPNVDFDGKPVSLFDLTEEKNADESVELLKKYL